MLVTCLPGVNRRNLRDNMRSVFNNVANLRGGIAGSAFDRLLAYLDWANNAVRMLSNQISTADLDRLVLTRRHELLLSGIGNLGKLIGAQGERFINGLVSLELEERVRDFEEAIKALDQQIERWSRLGVFVMADSSVYIQHSEKLEEWNFTSMISVREEDVHLLVPMVVVDELDSLKQSKNPQTRWRAGYTLAVLDRLFQRTTNPARLRDSDFSPLNSGGIPHGEVTVELLFDPPGHIRLPINDDEIVSRAVAIEPLASRRVKLLTYDTGQSTRGRAAGLEVVKLRQPIGEEPE